MKKRLLVILLVLVYLLLYSACDNKTEDTDTNESTNISIVEDTDIEKTINLVNSEDIINAFYYDEDNNLYYSSANKSDTIYYTDGKGSIIEEYILNLDPANEFKDLPISFNELTVDNGNIYYLFLVNDFENKKITKIIGKYNIESKTCQELDRINNSSTLGNDKICVVENTLFYLIPDPEYADTFVSKYKVEDNFQYFGERIRTINIDTLEKNDFGIDLPINFAKSSESELIIYAYDEADGYYFMQYDTEEALYGDKQFNNIINLNNFEMTGTEDYIIGRGYVSDFFLVKISDAESRYSIIDNINPMRNKFAVKDNKIYCYDTSGGVSELSLKEIKYDIKTLTAKTLNLIGNTNLPTLGFSINARNVEWDEIALKVMAGDTDWDICFMNSSYAFLKMIEYDLFVPLNGIPEVELFYDKTFPYIKDAATTDSGKIWSLIYDINGNWLTYSPEKLNNYGIDLSDDDDFYTLMDKLVMLKNIAPENSVAIPYISFGLDSLYDYSLNYSNIGIDKLKEFALSMYQNQFNSNNISLFDNHDVALEFHNAIMDNYVLADDYDSFETSIECLWNEHYLAGNDYYLDMGLRFIPIPSAFSDTYSVNCKFVFVNPLSKNKEYVLEYIAKLAEDKMKNDDTFMFNDKELYNKNGDKSEYFDIYAKAAEKSYINFLLPVDMLYYDFESLMEDKLSLEEMVNKINNKLNIYYNE